MSSLIKIKSKKGGASKVIKEEIEIVSDSDSDTDGKTASDFEDETASESDETAIESDRDETDGYDEEEIVEKIIPFNEDTRLLTYDNVPKSFDDLDFNPDVNVILKTYSTFKGVMPHLIVNGGEGSGKLTRIRCMLNEIYGDSIFKMANRIHNIKIRNGSSTKTVSYGYMEGSYHFEIEPHLYSSNDKYVIQNFIKRLSDFDNLVTGGVTFIVVKGLDKLSFLAQQGLRRLMELKMFNVKLIFTCECLNKVTAAILSRCYVVLNPCVTVRSGCKVLRKVIDNWPKCPDGEGSKGYGTVLSKRVSHICNISGDGLSGYTNLSKALRKLQLSYSSGKYIAQKISFHNEMELLYKITVSGKRLGLIEVEKIRELLYSLYIELVDFRRFLIMFCNKCKTDEKIFNVEEEKYHKLLHLIADTDEKLNYAVKPTLPLENFCYKLFWLVHYE